MPVRMIAGRKIETGEHKVPIEKLRLDPSNVRFNHIPGPLSDKQLEDEIWKEDDTRNLMKSIQASKGLVEPPLVFKENGDYTTKEGNRRLVALRKLKEAVDNGDIEDFPTDYFGRIPVEVIPKKISSVEMDLVLAILHVSGKNEWDALNKASHIYKLHREKGLTYEQISGYLGTSKSTIVRSMDAFEECQKYLQKYKNDPVGIRRFTYFDEFFKKTYLKNKSKLNRSFLEKFGQWLSSGKFKTHRDVRKLPDILDDPDALKSFEKGTIEDSVKTLYSKFPQLGGSLWESVASTTDELRNMSRSEVQALSSDPIKRQLFNSMLKEAQSIENEVKKFKRTRVSH